MPKTLADRFFETIDKQPEPDGCWLWVRLSKTSFGYGQIWQPKSEGGAKWEAHRLSWTIHHGPIPAGASVLHRCDHPSCCNPDHLFLGTQTDNLRDMWKKGRGASQFKTDPPKGVKNANAKLTDDDVREIRKLRSEGWSLTRLGRKFGVWKTTIHDIDTGFTWKHVQ